MLMSDSIGLLFIQGPPPPAQNISLQGFPLKHRQELEEECQDLERILQEQERDIETFFFFFLGGGAKKNQNSFKCLVDYFASS